MRAESVLSLEMGERRGGAVEVESFSARFRPRGFGDWRGFGIQSDVFAFGRWFIGGGMGIGIGGCVFGGVRIIVFSESLSIAVFGGLKWNADFEDGVVA